MKLLFAFCLLVFSSINCCPGGVSAAEANPAKSNTESESCVATAKGPISASSEEHDSIRKPSSPHQAAPLAARVGKTAPDFEANAFQNGKFKTMRLSDHRGRWVALCFYPGDFTFV